jgi:hypothetical protein
MDQFGNVRFENKELEDERLELRVKDAHYFLGPHLTLRRCTVILNVSAKRLFINQARFIDCTFEVKQELKNHQDWIGASIKGCLFRGRLKGCDFGHWPEYSSAPWCQFGSIEDCDFTEARLDNCRFMGCDPSTLRFPKWPCFTILDPIRRAPELRGFTWQGPLGELIRDMLPKHPPRTRALTYYAPSAARLVETTPEEIRAVIERFDGIVY